MANFSWELVDLLSWRDLLDILAVSTFIYGILHFLRITKGLQIFRGIVVLAGFWLLAELLNLRTLPGI